MAMWYAPVFVAWHRLQPVKALFYSLVGVWRNRSAFAVYLLGWIAVAIGCRRAAARQAAAARSLLPRCCCRRCRW